MLAQVIGPLLILLIYVLLEFVGTAEIIDTGNLVSLFVCLIVTIIFGFALYRIQAIVNAFHRRRSTFFAELYR